MDFRDNLSLETYFRGEDIALENLTIGVVKQDNIECCVCFNYHWGVKLPNCDHFICPKCYYKIYNGYISSDFCDTTHEPLYPEPPIYPYQNKDHNYEIYLGITNDDTYLEWFVNENEDLYNSVMLNSEFIDDLDCKIKNWFETDDLLKQYNENILKYKNELATWDDAINDYNEKYDEEKENNAHQKCPLCRL